MVRKLLLTLGMVAIVSNINVRGQDNKKLKKFFEEIAGENVVKRNPTGDSLLTLKQAILIALRNNPGLKSKHLEISAYEAAALQAALYPNPVLSIEAENFAGTGNYNGFGLSENTFLISQDFVLGGKLTKAKKLQLLNSRLAQVKWESERLMLITKIRRIFISISTLQRLERLNRKLLKISQDFIENLKRRIEAGKVSPAEAARASLISTSLEIKLESIKMEISSQLAELKMLLGVKKLKISSVENICNVKYDIPAIDELQKLILENPNLKQFKIRERGAEASLELEKAKVIPDLSLGVGLKRITETKDNVLVISLSVPVPIFNNNSGNIEKARVQISQVDFSFKNSVAQANSKLSLLYNSIKTLEVVIDKLKNESLPKAKEALQIISKGNLAGRFTVLDVLDAQKNLFELESQFVNAVSEYNRKISELEMLTLTRFNFQ